MQTIIISSGTLNPFTLLPLFYAYLSTLSGSAAARLASNWADTFPVGFSGLNLYHVRDAVERGLVDMDIMGYLLADVTDALQDNAPPGTYFGSAEGDGACFGFWPTGEPADAWQGWDEPEELARDLLALDEIDRPAVHA